MSLLVSKIDPTGGLVEFNTPERVPFYYYLYSKSEHAKGKWPEFDIITTVPNTPPKYWKDSGNAIIEMTQSEKDAVDNAMDRDICWFVSNRIDYKKIFMCDIAWYVTDKHGYSKAQVLRIFNIIGHSLYQMDMIDFEGAIETVTNIESMSIFLPEIKTKVIDTIEAYIKSEA